MADFHGITGAGEALVRLFQASYSESVLDHELFFKLSARGDFASTPTGAGITVFLYRVSPNGSHRTPPGRQSAMGERRLSSLPLDLHYLLTFWAGEPSLQHSIAGWAMRLLEDTPILPHAHLERASPGVFREDEQLELLADDISHEDLFQLWDVLAPEHGYELSVAYLVRNLRIESSRTLSTGPAVREREIGMVRE
ncbi:MAG: DUF4255 domain-containing protein [Phycisphaerales bacterium]